MFVSDEALAPKLVVLGDCDVELRSGFWLEEFVEFSELELLSVESVELDDD